MLLRCSTMPRYVNEKAVCSSQETEIKPKNEYSTDIKSLNKPQLLELLERQNRLIRSLALGKLPDKGQKVKTLKKDIEAELEKRDKTQDISDVLANLSINEKKIDVIEWGEKNPQSCKEHKPLNNEVVDELNPICILATHSGTNYNQKKIQTEREEESVITLADIEEAYALNLCNKIDKAEPKKKFLPHKTLVSNSVTPNPKVRDLSAATPPLPVFGDVKLISLEESLKLQYEQTKHLKEVQIRHATERLKDLRYKMGDALPSGESINIYRDNVNAQYSEEEESAHEDE